MTRRVFAINLEGESQEPLFDLQECLNPTSFEAAIAKTTKLAIELSPKEVDYFNASSMPLPFPILILETYTWGDVAHLLRRNELADRNSSLALMLFMEK